MARLCSLHPMIAVALLFTTALSLAAATASDVEFECEHLEATKCAFAVSSSGARCVLEKTVNKEGHSLYSCQTSSVMAEAYKGWVESNECIRTCGLQRLSVGMSTDALHHEPGFTRRLCLSPCRVKCPNVNNLYTMLAEGEGIKLDNLCDAIRKQVLRARMRAAQHARQEEEHQKQQAELAHHEHQHLAEHHAANANVANAHVHHIHHHRHHHHHHAQHHMSVQAPTPAPASSPVPIYQVPASSPAPVAPASSPAAVVPTPSAAPASAPSHTYNTPSSAPAPSPIVKESPIPTPAIVASPPPPPPVVHHFTFPFPSNHF